MLSRELEQTLHRALAYANERRHAYATLEHLLLAMTEDHDGAAALRDRGLDLDRLRRDLTEYIDSERSNVMGGSTSDAKPTAGFQRVLQRASIHAQSSGYEEVTGADLLVSLLSQRESHAVEFIAQQTMPRSGTANFITQDAVWTFTR